MSDLSYAEGGEGEGEDKEEEKVGEAQLNSTTRM